MQAQVQHSGALLGLVAGVPGALPQRGEGLGLGGVPAQLHPHRDAVQVYRDGGSGRQHLRLQPLQQ